jgi:hypothetical protein
VVHLHSLSPVAPLIILPTGESFEVLSPLSGQKQIRKVDKRIYSCFLTVFAVYLAGGVYSVAFVTVRAVHAIHGASANGADGFSLIILRLSGHLYQVSMLESTESSQPVM